MNLASPTSVATGVALGATAALLARNPLFRKVSLSALECFTNFVAHPEITLAITALAATSRSINLCSSSEGSKDLLKILTVSGLIKCIFSHNDLEELEKGKETAIAGAFGLLGLTFIDVSSIDFSSIDFSS